MQPTLIKFYAALHQNDNDSVILWKSRRACTSFYDAQTASEKALTRLNMNATTCVITECFIN